MRKKWLFALLLAVLVGTGAWLFNKSIGSSAAERERHFKAIKFYVDDYFSGSGEYPNVQGDEGLRLLLEGYKEISYSPGVDYTIQMPSGYELRESDSSWVTVFRKGRLVADESTQVRWGASD